MSIHEINDIRVTGQDLQMTGTAVTFGLTYAARVYHPLAEALLNPKLFLNVAGRLGAGDSVRLFFTDRGNRQDVEVYEFVDLVVRGFRGREPLMFQCGPIFRMEDDDTSVSRTPQPDAAEADLRDGLRIERRETGQGRGRPKLISWDVYDGTGAVVFSDNDEEVARTWARNFGAAA